MIKEQAEAAERLKNAPKYTQAELNQQKLELLDEALSILAKHASPGFITGGYVDIETIAHAINALKEQIE